ncbi:OmpA family protein [Hymenobacter humi]|uniref:OmpA family protein n=1 Tax=Hymenobacter humi TaxID=1411620 RepID=A0ABW2U319_9BACT
MQLENVQFEQGEALLLPTSYAALDKLVSLMTDNPRMTIELRGHTDNVGPPEKNVVLSEQRVGTVKAYLVDHGIGEARISGIGFGGAQPTASNDQEHTRRLNRRVEFRITGLQ